MFYEGQQLIVRLEQNAWDNQLIPLETQTTTDTTYQMVGVTSLSGNRGNSGMADNLTDILGLIPLIDDGLKTILETDLSVIIFFSGFPSNNKL